MGNRSSHASARGILRARLQRMTHRIEVLGGDDGNGNRDADAWMRRYTAMIRWAQERCGNEGYTTTSRSVERGGEFRDYIVFHFESPKHLNAFQAVFLDKWRG